MVQRDHPRNLDPRKQDYLGRKQSGFQCPPFLAEVHLNSHISAKHSAIDSFTCLIKKETKPDFVLRLTDIFIHFLAQDGKQLLMTAKSEMNF